VSEHDDNLQSGLEGTARFQILRAARQLIAGQLGVIAASRLLISERLDSIDIADVDCVMDVKNSGEFLASFFALNGSSGAGAEKSSKTLRHTKRECYILDVELRST